MYTCFPWQPASATNPTTTYLVPLVLADAVLFHATLLSLSPLSHRKGPENGSRVWNAVDLLCLQSECIRLLRERVEKTGSDGGIELGVSDQTISAVVALAAFEVRS